MNNFIKIFSKKSPSFHTICVFSIFCAIFFLVFTHWQKTILTPEKLLSCTTSSHGRDTADAFCLERVVTDLMKTYQGRDLLTYITAPSTPEVLHVYGHTIGHLIGKQIFLKIGSVEASLEQCAPDSQYGCIHGVIGAAVFKELGENPTKQNDLAHADSTTMEHIAEKYCASDDLNLCHAVGHIFFQVSSDYTKILPACDHVSNKDINKKEICSRGVFMESAGPMTALSPSLKPLDSDNNYHGICSQISSPYQHACFRYLPKIQNILFEKNGIYGAPERIAIAKNICMGFTKAPRADCIESIGLNAGGTFRDPQSNEQNFCKQFAAGADTQACILGMAGSFIKNFHYDEGINYCHNMADPTLQNFCFHVLFRITEQISMGSKIEIICNKKQTAQKCNQELKEYLAMKSILPNYFLGLYGNSR